MYTLDNQQFLDKLKKILEDQIFESNDNRYPCVVFDIDGTLINPVTNQIIKPVVDFFQYCNELGMKNIIVTARPGSPYNIEYTVNLLKSLGIHTQFYNFMKPELFYENKQREYKEEARKEILKKHEILMSIGDMIFDMDTYCNVGVLVKSYNNNTIDYYIEHH
tara:strand:+ start:1765 stop:2253 length:489 start_codon:yes stop_codon:yes gene_type:complete